MSGMNFGDALTALKAGKLVSRQGWNGKGMYLFLELGNFSTHGLPDRATGVVSVEGVSSSLFNIKNDGSATRLPHLAMRSATGSTVTGWLASQTDMLAEDWGVVSIGCHEGQEQGA